MSPSNSIVKLPFIFLVGVFFLGLIGYRTLAYGHGPDIAPVVVLDADVNGKSLSPYLFYWHDQSDQSTFASALKAYSSGDFHPLQERYTNLGFKTGHNWFAVTLQNSTILKRTLLVEVDYAALDELDFYCFGEDQKPSYYPAGDHLQYSSRSVKVRSFVLPLAMEAAEQLHCLIRVHTSTNVALPIKAYDPVSYIETSHGREQYLGVIYGIALALLLYNLIQ